MSKSPAHIGQPFVGATKPPKPYEEDLLKAVSEILENYEIHHESRLADVVYLTMNKFILGLDEKLKAYNQWFDRHGTKIEGIKADYTGSYPQDCVEMAMDFNIVVTPEYDQLLKIDMGRNKAVLTAYRQLSKYKNEIGLSHRSDPAYGVLGSIVRRAIDIHQSHTEGDIEVTVGRHPEISILAIQALRKAKID